VSTSSTRLPAAEGRGSVSQAPNLPADFTDTFSSRYVDAGDVRLHAVIGGDGPPLLLVHGWPQTWYAWRMVMPALARDFEVIAVDQRGRRLRGADSRRVSLATAARCTAAQRAALAPDVQPAPRRGQRSAGEGKGRRLLRRGVDASAGTNKLPDAVVRYYIDTLAADPEALRGSFEIYRAFPEIIAQNELRKNRA
jgi:pimeloyl-ACP methyl ester carboxylesterase